jgi:hypothetical protein
MADVVVVEYRGISGELAVGERLAVKAVGAGVLELARVYAEPEPDPLPASTEGTTSAEGATNG